MYFFSTGVYLYWILLLSLVFLPAHFRCRVVGQSSDKHFRLLSSCLIFHDFVKKPLLGSSEFSEKHSKSFAAKAEIKEQKYRYIIAD
jgi:hypothetical protein